MHGGRPQSRTSSGTYFMQHGIFIWYIEYLDRQFGDAEGCREIIEDRMATVCMFWEKLLEIQDPQVAFHLLRLCASTCRLLYLFRTTPPHITKPQAKDLTWGCEGCSKICNGGMPDALGTMLISLS